MTNEPTNPATIQIRGEPTADAAVCRFVADRPVFAGGSHVCSSREAAKGSPLLESLFAIEGVTQAWVAGHEVTIQKQGPTEWPVVGKSVGAAIRAFLAQGIPFVAPGAPAGAAAANGGPTEALIRDVLERQVNPGVAGHGGKIELIELKGGAVYLKMSGGCQGCGAAKVTLKQGVEKTLRALVPGITDVIDVTDHDAGRNPFFARNP